MLVPTVVSRRSTLDRNATIMIAVLLAAAIVAAFYWGRSVVYTASNPSPAFTLTGSTHTLTQSGGAIAISKLYGWDLQVWKLRPEGAMDPVRVNLSEITVRAMRAPGLRGPAKDEVPRKYETPGAGSTGNVDGKNVGEAKQAPVQQYPVQQSPNQESPKQQLLEFDPTKAYRPKIPAEYSSSDLLRARRPAPSFALSTDGTRAAWVTGTDLFTAPVGRSIVATYTPLGRTGCHPEVGRNIVVVACDTTLEIRGPQGGEVLSGREQPIPWELRKDGDNVIAISGTEAAELIDASRAYTHTHKGLPHPVSAVGRSPSGRLLAAASNEGTVAVFAEDDSPAWTLKAPGVVDAVTFLDERRLLVGGAFRGLHVISRDADSEVLVDDVVGARFIAVLPQNRVAVADNDELSIFGYGRSRAFTTVGKVLLGSAAALFVPLLVFGSRYARRTRVPENATLAESAATADVAAPPAPPVQQPSVPTPFFELADPPEGLIRACVEGNCVLFAGAGMSAQAGYPTWTPFVQELLKWSAETKKIDEGFAQSLEAALGTGQVDSVADALVSAVPKRDVLAKLSEMFGRENPMSDAHQLLKRIPLSAALTTNFDTLLERTYPEAAKRVLTPRDSERLAEILGRREFFIGKLYGSLSEPESVLVAPAEFIDTVSRNLTFSQFMESMFVSRTMFFVGASLEGIEAYLSGLTFRGQMTRPHFALVAVTDAGWRAKADLLRRRYGIEVMPFTPGARFAEVPQFLERLAELISTQKAPSSEMGTVAPPGVKKLHLTNIGPFVDMSLDLQSDWNVLLGDNGVGKSSILKAIAACFCGKDAEPYAARLIRAGEPSGTILMETGRNTYRMEIKRKDSTAEITVVPARPLEVEGVLVLGFPPLRAVTWDRPKGPTSEGRRRPTAEDILPLVKGDPDPRLDRLKQWIVNLDSRINYEKTNRTGDDRYERLLKRFFEIVDKLTPGMAIAFGRVNPDTREVTVVTEDGEIPIEMVSQGSVSLMGWIGILLQRLYEIYGSDEDPMQRYALVLIDEIDAHMHPEWQQSVVDDMSVIFKNVQFVATTHSALVVGGMQGRQVKRFVRDESGETIQLKVTDEMLVGRADQILTGRLFGMKTTLDSQTQKSMEEYKGLLGNSDRTNEQEDRFQRLNKDLRFKIPVAEETTAERKAFALVEAIVNDQLAAATSAAREPLLDKAKALLDECSSPAQKAR